MFRAVLICIGIYLSVQGTVPEDFQWYGSSTTDLAHAEKFAGRLLRVKACFVKKIATDKTGKQIRGRRLPPVINFLVEAAGGEISCKINRRAPGMRLLRNMKRGTPIVMEGKLEGKRNTFIVEKMVQGWGQKQLDGIWQTNG